MITNTSEIVDMVADRLRQKSGPLGIKFVGQYEEQRIPEYPAVVIIPGVREKELHSTNTFQVRFRLELFIYHADLTLTKRERSKADLQLVTAIETELESDYRWFDDGSPRVIHAYVTDETPGITQMGSNKSDMVISTRLSWMALSQRRM